MSRLYTRAEFRDRLRRKLEVVPPIDIPYLGALPGAQPTNYPRPTNQQINDALQDAISDINQWCGFHVSQYDVPVDAIASDTFGPFGIDMATLTPTNSTTALTSPTANILNILRVLWQPDSSSVPYLLTGGNRNSIDRSGLSNYYATFPGSPRQWWVEQYKLWISPSQVEAGTYTLTCGDGIVGLQSDSDTLDQVPIDFQSVFEDQAIVRLAMTQTMDVEANERAQMFGPVARAGMLRFKAWKEGETGTPYSGLAFTANYRGGYGTRRTVR